MCSPLSEIVLHMYFTHHRVKYGGNACARRWLGELLPRPTYISQETFLNSDYFIFDGTSCFVIPVSLLYRRGNINDLLSLLVGRLSTTSPKRRGRCSNETTLIASTKVRTPHNTNKTTQ